MLSVPIIPVNQYHLFLTKGFGLYNLGYVKSIEYWLSLEPKSTVKGLRNYCNDILRFLPFLPTVHRFTRVPCGLQSKGCFINRFPPFDKTSIGGLTRTSPPFYRQSSKRRVCVGGSVPGVLHTTSPFSYLTLRICCVRRKGLLFTRC